MTQPPGDPFDSRLLRILWGFLLHHLALLFLLGSSIFIKIEDSSSAEEVGKSSQTKLNDRLPLAG